MVDSTIEFYNKHAKDFYLDTLNADMSMQYSYFEAHLNKGARILDAGCGSGRDCLYFLQQGYQVEAFDASEKMVVFSSKLTLEIISIAIVSNEGFKLN